jgi:hypothetical protein
MRKQQRAQIAQQQQQPMMSEAAREVSVYDELARVKRSLDTLRENEANLMRCVNESAERNGWGAPSVARGLDLIEALAREEQHLLMRRQQLRVAAALVAARAS